MARVCYPNLVNHKLNTHCDYLGVSLSHHDAESDSCACACAELLLDFMSKGIKVDSFSRQDNIKEVSVCL